MGLCCFFELFFKDFFYDMIGVFFVLVGVFVEGCYDGIKKNVM